MKKFIKALYWAYFPDAHQRDMERHISSLQSEVRYLESIMLAMHEGGPEHTIDEVNSKIFAIKEHRADKARLDDLLKTMKS